LDGFFKTVIKDAHQQLVAIQMAKFLISNTAKILKNISKDNLSHNLDDFIGW